MNKLLILVLGLNLFAGDFFYEYGKKVELTPINPQTRSLDTINDVKYFTTKDGKKIGIKHEIIVKLKEKVNSTHFFASYSLTLVKKIANRTFLVKLYDDQDVFKFSQELHQNPNTEYAVPNKVQKVYKR